MGENTNLNSERQKAHLHFLDRLDSALGRPSHSPDEMSNNRVSETKADKPYHLMSTSEIAALVPALFEATGEDRAYSGIGSRETPPDVCADMNAIGGGLALRGFTLRSGGADGADLAFEQSAPGVMTTADERPRDIFVPWKGFNLPAHLKNNDTRFYPVDGPGNREITARAEEIARRAHPAWDKCSQGAKKLHTRNVHQVLGMKLDSPVRFVVAWTVDGGPTGGTGQAIRIANELNIPVLNLYHREVRDAVLKQLEVERERQVAHSVESEGKASEPMTLSSEGSFNLTVEDWKSQDWPRDGVVTFCKVREENGILSNMHNGAEYTDGGLRWKSTEAQYQAARFPHRPDIQEQVRLAPNAFVAKQVAKEYVAETRPDWEHVRVPMMAYVLSRKVEASKEYRDALANAWGKSIVEISARDAYWGAVSRNGVLTGRNILGGLHDQVGAGARLNELPRGTTFPSPAQALELAKKAKMAAGAQSNTTQAGQGEAPKFKSSMYFNYGRSRRPGVEAESTFEAILTGERTSTTRFPQWGGYDRWSNMQPGDKVRFFEDREMQGRHVDVRITGVDPIDLAECSRDRLAEWSKVEGWSEEAGRSFGARYGAGAQIRYEAIEGQEILKERTQSMDDTLAHLSHMAALRSGRGR